jgi:hypothetical protein
MMYRWEHRLSRLPKPRADFQKGSHIDTLPIEENRRGTTGVMMPADYLSSRDPRVDFFRGIALILIFYDHVHGSPLLLRYFTFFDASEVFICISGYISYLVYGSMLNNYGIRPTATKIYKRVGKLYIANFLIFLFYFLYVVISGESSPYISIDTVFQQAIDALVSFKFKVPFLGVLPVYMMLLAILPIILYALRKNVLVTLLVSFSIYFSTLIILWDIPYFNSAHWVNPLSWQFLFVIGASIRHLQTHRRRILIPEFIPIKNREIYIVNKWNWITIGAWTIVIGCAIFSIPSVNELIFPGGLPWRLFQSKEFLAPVRLANFLAVVIVINSFVSRESEFLRWTVSKPVILLGQNSLVTFCTGVLMTLILQPIFIVGDMNDKVSIVIVGVTMMMLSALTRRRIKSTTLVKRFLKYNLRVT